MIWQDEIKAIDQLSCRVTNLASDISRKMTEYESRKTTLENEIQRLQADYIVIQSRNEEAKKEFQRSRRLDLEQFEDNSRRVKIREMALIESQNEIQKLKAELEMEIASARTTKQTMEALGRNHGRK